MAVHDETARDSMCDVLLGPLDGAGQAASQRQISSDRGGIRAAGAVRPNAPDEWRAQQQLRAPVKKNVHGLRETSQMSALDQRGTAVTRLDFTRNRAHALE